MANPSLCGNRARNVWTLLAPVMIVTLCGGCKMFDQPMTGAAKPAFQWLAGMGEEQNKPTSPLDMNAIRPVPQTDQVQSGDLLEITVSHLFQPEERYTFPARVRADGYIDVPLLESPLVTGLTRADIEKGLAEEYQRNELLVNPTIVVRNLEVPRVKIHVKGAVERPGLVALPREDASVYAALVSAGVKANAGNHISVARPLTSAPVSVLGETAGMFAVNDEEQAATVEVSVKPSQPEMRAGEVATSINSSNGGAAPADTMAALTTTAPQPSAASGVTQHEVIWFDVQREEDRRALIELRLNDGDIVGVSELVPPIRVLGAVQNPGSLNIPDSDQITVLDGIQLAGGLLEGEDSLEISIIRVSETGWPGRKWTGSYKKLIANPEQAPKIHPGDVIHIEKPGGNNFLKTIEGWLEP